MHAGEKGKWWKGVKVGKGNKKGYREVQKGFNFGRLSLSPFFSFFPEFFNWNHLCLCHRNFTTSCSPKIFDDWFPISFWWLSYESETLSQFFHFLRGFFFPFPIPHWKSLDLLLSKFLVSNMLTKIFMTTFMVISDGYFPIYLTLKTNFRFHMGTFPIRDL
jgi:hypothetical protein